MKKKMAQKKHRKNFGKTRACLVMLNRDMRGVQRPKGESIFRIDFPKMFRSGCSWLPGSMKDVLWH